MGTRSSRLLVCGAVAVAAGLGWSPAAHAAGLGASLPAVTPSVSTAPPVSASHVISTVDRVTRAVASRVVSAEQQTVARVKPTVSPPPTTRRRRSGGSAPRGNDCSPTHALEQRETGFCGAEAARTPLAERRHPAGACGPKRTRRAGALSAAASRMAPRRRQCSR